MRSLSVSKVLYALIAALLLLETGAQFGMRQRPVITAAPCVEEKSQLCLVDQHNREVRVLGDGSVVYATPEPRATNTKWSVP